MGAEDDIKGILGAASQICFVGTVCVAGRESFGHWLYHPCGLCNGAKCMRCKTCNATGKLAKPESNEFSFSVSEEVGGSMQCMFCGGSGSVKCERCMGAGGEIGKRLNYFRMFHGTKPFNGFLKNRNMNVIPTRLDEEIARTARMDVMTQFHDSVEDFKEMVSKKKFIRALRAKTEGSKKP